MNIRQAKRQNAYMKMSLQGPSGCGKTYSSLLLAYGLVGDWSQICIIDAENNSADLYAHLGQYNVLPLKSPFTPEKYKQAIDTCTEVGIQVIILDSISREWDGEGGILEIHGNMTGNSFTNWHKVTPRHNAFVQAMLQCPAHVIATIRAKQDYVLNEKNGKHVPEKVGLKGITRGDLDYEFTLAFDLDIKHMANVSKDRTELFEGQPPFKITPAIGERIKNWCMEGESLDELRYKIEQCSSLEVLRELYKDHPSSQKALKSAFMEKSRELKSINESKIKENGTVSTIGESTPTE